MTNPGSPRIMVGDVWDALEPAFQVTKVATGRRLLVGPGGPTIVLYGRELVGGWVAAESLIAVLASWGITPVASDKVFAAGRR